LRVLTSFQEPKSSIPKLLDELSNIKRLYSGKYTQLSNTLLCNNDYHEIARSFLKSENSMLEDELEDEPLPSATSIKDSSFNKINFINLCEKFAKEEVLNSESYKKVEELKKSFEKDFNFELDQTKSKIAIVRSMDVDQILKIRLDQKEEILENLRNESKEININDSESYFDLRVLILKLKDVEKFITFKINELNKNSSYWRGNIPYGRNVLRASYKV
jgi:hypothetical protein